MREKLGIGKSERDLLDALEGMARQHCFTDKDNGETDSGAIGADADALEKLDEYDRFRIVRGAGRMVVGFWPEDDPELKETISVAPVAPATTYVDIGDALPPPDKNIVAILLSGIPVLGRNIDGRFCQYDSFGDRFVEPPGDGDGFSIISHWGDIPQFGVRMNKMKRPA